MSFVVTPDVPPIDGSEGEDFDSPLRGELATTAGAGMVGYSSLVTYPDGTVGKTLESLDQTLRSDLADSSNDVKGAGLVAYSNARTYANGTIGAEITALLAAIGVVTTDLGNHTDPAKGSGSVGFGSGLDYSGEPNSVGLELQTARTFRTNLPLVDSPSHGAGMVGFAYSIAYGNNTIGKWLRDLSNNAGANFVGYQSALAGSVLRTVLGKLNDGVSVRDFGAIGDGSSHPLSSITLLGAVNTTGWTLGQWQAFWPHVTALTNELDWAAAQAALNTGQSVFWPDAGNYQHDQVLVSNTYNQRLYGNGRLPVLFFDPAVGDTGILLTGANGRQQVFGLNLNGNGTCAKVLAYESPQVQIFCNWITAFAAGSIAVYAINEGGGPPLTKFDFGAQIGYNFIHGSFTAGSRGVRLGLNSQATSIFRNTIDHFETGIAVPRNTDALAIEFNIIEEMMNTGHGVDMRSEASSSTYQAVTIRGNHFEDLYSAICWGTTGGSGATYTSNDYSGNKFVGNSGGPAYFFTINGTCGAGCANNRVAYNDVQDNVTFCFDFNDANGAASIIDRKGNTVPSGKWAAGSSSDLAYTLTQVNFYFGNAVVSGSLASGTGPTRVECQTGVYRVAIPWTQGEYLESLAWTFLPIGSTPQVTGVLTSGVGDTTAVVATSGVQTGTNGVKKVITLAVDTMAVQGLNYWMEFTHALGGGTTAFDYVGVLRKRW